MITLEEYTVVYEEYYCLACKIAMDHLGDYHLAGDVAQEVFYEMYVKKELLDSSQIKFWVMKNSNRRALDALKRAYKKHENSVDYISLDTDLKTESEDPEDMVLRKETVRCKATVLRMLRNHNEQWYDILMKHYLDNESYQSLAQHYDIELAYLRMQVHRARKWMDMKFDELFGEELPT